MSILNTIESEVFSAASVVEHCIASLVGMALVAQKDVQTLEADSPIVKDAIIAGEAAAAAHGVPVAEIATVAGEVLSGAQQVMTALQTTTTTTTTTTAPAA